jgi:hypothetical protein
MFTTTQRGKPMLIHEVFKYIIDYKKKETYYWICQKTLLKCTGLARIHGKYVGCGRLQRNSLFSKEMWNAKDITELGRGQLSVANLVWSRERQNRICGTGSRGIFLNIFNNRKFNKFKKQM